MNVKRFLSLLIVVLMLSLGLAMLNPGAAQSPSQDDAGAGRDAGNTASTALPLSSPTPTGELRFSGELLADTDEVDWYRFSTGRTVNTGDVAVTVMLLSDWTADFDLELYETPPNEGPTKVGDGTGATGSRAIQWSADRNTGWLIRVSGEDMTGSYQVTLRLDQENDGGSNRDTGVESTTHVPVTIPSSGSIVMAGFLQPGDGAEGDHYRFTSGGVGESLLVTLYHPPSASGFRLQLSDSNTIGSVTAQSRSGPGFKTAFVPNPTADQAWTATVTSTTASHGGAYYLAFRTAAEADGDHELIGDSDASETASGAKTIQEGIFEGRVSTGTGDRSDYYSLGTVPKGETIIVGLGSYRQELQRPLVVLELHSRSTTPASPLSSVSVCDQAGQITWTAEDTAEYLVRVAEIAADPADASCPTETMLSRNNNYVLFYERQQQQDGGTPGDAATSSASGSAIASSEVQRGWVDDRDEMDSYVVGNLGQGDIIRIVAVSEVPSMPLKLTLYDAGQQARQSVTMSGGAARIHASAVNGGTHTLQIVHTGSAAGTYRFYVETSPDEAPVPVNLLSIRDEDTERTRINLRWTEQPDPDFARYEVHMSQQSPFTPSASTLQKSITDRETTSTSVSNLQSGTTYHFIIRTVDNGGRFSDSNQRSGTTEGSALTNQRPTLSGGDVDPDEGTPDMTYKYTVRYRDADNDPPTQKFVFINGEPHQMTTTDTVYDDSDGALFELQTGLGAGQHSFYFEFSDGDAMARDPSVVQGSYQGPTVSTSGNNPPTVSAEADPDDGEAPLTVQFTATATDEDEDSLSYCWDFDNSDGVTCQDQRQNPVHEYEDPGEFTAVVRVTDSQGSTSSDSVTVNVRPPANQPPTASPSADPSSGAPPLTVQFSANANDADGSIQSYSWDFDNGNGIQQDSAQENPTHTYQTAGSFTATVTVTDNGGKTASASVTVTVSTENNSPPSVFVDATPTRGSAPMTVQFNANAVDPDGDDLTITWDFDRSDGIQEEATGASVTNTYSTQGTFTATATARDPSGAPATGTVQITVLAGTGGNNGGGQQGPLFIQADPRSADAPVNVTFTADTELLDASVASYEWDFGDGGVSEEGPITNYEYNTPGLYEVTLTVVDVNGQEYQSTITIEVREKGSPGIGLPLMLVAAALAGLAIHRNARRPGKE